MDNSFHRQGQGSDTQQDRKSFLVSLPILDSIIKWLARSLIKLTKEEQENAGVYLGRLGDE